MRSFAVGRGRTAARLVLLVLPIVVGCGPGRGKVSGQVRFHGAPLPGGTVNFRPADPTRNAVSAVLDEEGRYEAVLPVGEVKVSIDNRWLQPRPNTNLGGELTSGLPLPPELRNKQGTPPAPAEQGGTAGTGPPRPSGRYVQIPERYHDVDQSGLEFTVTGGDQPHDFELTD